MGFATILLTVLATVFIAEMGDKTQLLLVAMAGKYKMSHILIGTWTATAVLNLLAVSVGAALSEYLDMRFVKIVAAVAFLWFAYSTLNGDEEEETEHQFRRKLHPVFAIFGFFFIGELGDKTQLSAITLAATYTQHSIPNAAAVFFGSTVGLILADLIGLVVGVVLRSKMPTKGLKWLSFAIFAVFGAVNCYAAVKLIAPSASFAMPVTALVMAAFSILCQVTAKKCK